MEDDVIQRIVKDEVDFEKFWALVPFGQAWAMALQNLTRHHRHNAKDFLIGLREDGAVVYFLNKEIFPVEVISKLTGIPVEKFTPDKSTITLPALEKVPRPDQPRPTITYWGEA